MPHPATIRPHYPVGHSFTELKSVDSTNNYAMAKVHAGLAFHGAVFFAHEQSAGKGQRGKTWITEAGANIIMSVVLQTDLLEIKHQFALSACIAVSCCDFFQRYAGTDCHIKWPNDLYWRDRKTGGILIENIILGTVWKHAIVGIGININQVEFPQYLTNPTSLKLATGRDYNSLELSKELCIDIENGLNTLISGNADHSLMEYNRRLYKKDEWVNLKKDKHIFKTRIKNVDAHGQLQTIDTAPRNFAFGEVEWMVSGTMNYE